MVLRAIVLRQDFVLLKCHHFATIPDAKGRSHHWNNMIPVMHWMSLSPGIHMLKLNFQQDMYRGGGLCGVIGTQEWILHECD